MRPILALNCLLQTEQERSEEESSVADALALAFRCADLLGGITKSFVMCMTSLAVLDLYCLQTLRR